MKPGPTIYWRCPSLPIWLLLVASLLLLVGSVWDVAWHRSLGREAFWIQPHVVLYSGVGLTGLVCAAVVLRTTMRRTRRAGTDPMLVEHWGLRAPLGFVLAGCGALGCVLVAPFDEWGHRMFGLDVTVWSPPHLFAVGAAGAIRLGGVVALAGEMSHAGHVMPPRQRSWYTISLAEGVLLVLFSLLLGNLTFVLGGYEYWATPQDRVAYTVMASLVVPVVLVAGVHRLRRIVVYGESGASTNVFWSPHVLPLSTLLAGVAGAVSGWAGALLSRRLLTPGVSAGRRWTRAPTGAAP